MKTVGCLSSKPDNAGSQQEFLFMRPVIVDLALARSRWQQETRVPVPDLVLDVLVLSCHYLRKQKGESGLKWLAPGFNPAF